MSNRLFSGYGTIVQVSECGFQVYGKMEMQFVDLKESIAYVAVGSHHLVVLMENGDVYGYGSNQYGQLGFRNCREVSKLHKPEKIPISGVWQIACGRDFTVAIMNDGKIVGTGYNMYGQLGQGGHRSTFEELEWGCDWENPHNLACGPESILVIPEFGGEMYVSGCNSQGQLGVGHDEDVWGFQKVPINGQVKQISASHHHTILRMENGSVLWAGFHNDIFEPIQLDPKSGIPIQVSCGDQKSFILTNQGILWYTQDSTNFTPIQLTRGQEKLTPIEISHDNTRTFILNHDGNMYQINWTLRQPTPGPMTTRPHKRYRMENPIHALVVGC